MWVCMAVVVIIFILILNSLFCMIDTRPVVNVGCSSNTLLYPSYVPCDPCIVNVCRKCIFYKFYSIHVFINNNALTKIVLHCPLLHTHKAETYSMLPFLKLILFIFSNKSHKIIQNYFRILVNGLITHTKISLRF